MGNLCSNAASRADHYRVAGGEGKENEKERLDTSAVQEAPAAAAKVVSTAASGKSGQIANYTGAKPKLDPKDFQFVGLKGEVKIKPPGSINGQAFTIDKCEDCDLYLIDFCGQVTIDDCINCRIFVGPTEGSVFIRDSKNCKCAFVCRQLRTRDCDSCNTALFCRTRPIIESSTNMGFSCYCLNYESLPGQMKAAKMSVLHNFWSHLYDFTSKSGNWKILSAEEGTVEALLGGGPSGPGLPAAAKEALGPNHGTEGPLMLTWGDRSPAPSPDYLFIIFSERQADQAMQFANTAKHQAVILRSNQAPVSPEIAVRITQIAGWSRSVERSISAGSAIGFEVSGPGCVQALHGVAHALGGHYTESEEAGTQFRHLGIDG